MAEKTQACLDDKEKTKGGDSLEDLMTTLHNQIKGSDWLKHNTAEKFEEENKELAETWRKAREETEQKKQQT